MNVPTQCKRIILGAALALAALASAVLSGPAQATAAPPTISPIEIRSVGTEATISFTSSEPVAVSIDYRPEAASNAASQKQAWSIYTTRHEAKLTGLTSNTAYILNATVRTQDNRTATAQALFTTTKKRIVFTLDSIVIEDDGDGLLSGDGEPLWLVGVSWTGNPGSGEPGSYPTRLCYPNDFGRCETGSFGAGRITPRNSLGQPLMIVFAEENFDHFPDAVSLDVTAKEDDGWAGGVAGLVECVTDGGCVSGDETPIPWRVPQGVESITQMLTLRGDDPRTGFESVLTFRVEVFHSNGAYPVRVRNFPSTTWHPGV